MTSHLLLALLIPKAFIISDAQTYLMPCIHTNIEEANLDRTRIRNELWPHEEPCEPCGHRLLFYCMITYGE
ncbi:hypothetical protein F4813DRAFT_344874 [Daldinia decipiens]|uniref:uncharacterized protein n=1 Tax=Daldinia decipiens TaxID=326647 RepID=UPI0020C59269|nr:uncharacterized protein F4813DRAFT_344874 [Daldinia decipiens]KAI1661556.1 hypothetical protein F4813DRAFT_344874 [Daldinia decipiens]